MPAYCIIVSDRNQKNPDSKVREILFIYPAAAAAVSAIAEADEEYGDNYNPKALVIKKIAKAVHILLSAGSLGERTLPFIIIYQGINRRLRLHGAYSQRRYGPHGFAPHFRAFPSL